MPPPGKNNATASLVLGIVSVVCLFFVSGLVSLILGIIGMLQAGKAKELGYQGDDRTAGYVLSLIGLVGGIVTLAACVACVGCAGALATTPDIILDPEVTWGIDLAGA